MNMFISTVLRLVVLLLAFAQWQVQAWAATAAEQLPGEATQAFSRAGGTPPRASNHALILVLSEYGPASIPPLKGTQKDAQTAADMARRMGVPDENIVTVRDGALTLDGIRQALQGLIQRVGDNDQVFLYFSGHGSRQLDRDSGQCVESLLSYEGRPLSSGEVTQIVKSLAAKVAKVIVMVDACHSGGVARVRDIGGTQFRAKFFAGADADSCMKPSNMLSRSLTAPGRKAEDGLDNVVYIAAARADEVALDTAEGGLATQALSACLQGKERVGGVPGMPSVADLKDCAQPLIEAKLKDQQSYAPHHITLSGNDQLVPVQTQSGVTSTQKVNPRQVLRLIASQRDSKRRMIVSTSRRAYKIGRDPLDFSITASRAGYLYILSVGSEGTGFDLVFPNQLDSGNRIEAGASLRLPRKEWLLTAQGPKGRDTLLFLVADSPRDFRSLGMEQQGAFLHGAGHAEMASKIRDLVLNGDMSQECAKTASRSLGATAVRQCSNAFGAAILEIDEIP